MQLAGQQDEALALLRGHSVGSDGERAQQQRQGGEAERGVQLS
jgi:hypothetical protein